MKPSWAKLGAVTVGAAAVTLVLGGIGLMSKVTDAWSVPSRVRTLEEQQKAFGDRLNTLSFDLKTMAHEQSASARRAEDSDLAIKSALAEISATQKAMANTLNEHTGQLLQTREQVKNTLVLIDNLSAKQKE
jgi:hypothetical protein